MMRTIEHQSTVPPFLYHLTYLLCPKLKFYEGFQLMSMPRFGCPFHQQLRCPSNPGCPTDRHSPSTRGLKNSKARLPCTSFNSSPKFLHLEARKPSRTSVSSNEGIQPPSSYSIIILALWIFGFEVKGSFFTNFLGTMPDMSF